MKVLFVTGGDFSAMDIEDNFGVEKAARLAEKSGGKCVIDNDEIYAELKILEFGEVDMEFVRFINDNFIDYDASKATNYFILD